MKCLSNSFGNSLGALPRGDIEVDINGNMQDAVRLIFRDDDLLYVNIHSLHKISKYSGQEGTTPAMSKLGSP
jgi:transcription-repair coupling factor (superfamily II helicase)